ncbi:MAG TPA: RNA helicase, partial [Candidatus Methylomirabilis sp.]
RIPPGNSSPGGSSLRPATGGGEPAASAQGSARPRAFARDGVGTEGLAGMRFPGAITGALTTA